MGFMRGTGAVRRVPGYLEKGKIVLTRDIRAVAIQWNPDDKGPANHGIEKFVFWHLPQLQFKNPRIHFGTFHKLTPTPWIKLFTKSRNDYTIDCDGRSREEIHDILKSAFGLPDEYLLEKERKRKQKLNPAGFGDEYPQQCICEVPGQLPCPSWKELPKEFMGKWHIRPDLRAQAEEEGEEGS